MLESLFYVKEALGINGRPIRVYKFRTMEIGADNHLEETLGSGLNHYGKPNRDERITRIGRFLRRYWLDEIPQIYNTVRGDLKLVGVRPMSEKSWERYPRDIKNKALKEKPGLLGVGSQHSHNDETFNLHLDVISRYLEDRETKKPSSDLNQFFYILSNILFRGVRSS